MTCDACEYVIDRYFSGCSASIAAHGGQVEKFIGDAVLAVFGADVTHEDDAVRAVRAAADSLAALSELASELASSATDRRPRSWSTQKAAQAPMGRWWCPCPPFGPLVLQASGHPGTPIRVGSGPCAIAITPDGATAYVVRITGTPSRRV